MNSSQSIDLANLVIKLFARLYAVPAAPGQPRKARSLMVTSVCSGEGKTFISRAIAHHASHLSDEKILLVDANFAGPRLHLEYGCPNEFGFSDGLATQEWDKVVFHGTALPGLMVLPAGQSCKLGLLFKKEQLKGFLQYAGNKFGLIIIDSAILKIGGTIFSSQVDGVALVVDSGKTRREVIQGTMDSLHVSKDRYLGVILNKQPHYIPKFLYRNL